VAVDLAEYATGEVADLRARLAAAADERRTLLGCSRIVGHGGVDGFAGEGYVAPGLRIGAVRSEAAGRTEAQKWIRRPGVSTASLPKGAGIPIRKPSEHAFQPANRHLGQKWIPQMRYSVVFVENVPRSRISAARPHRIFGLRISKGRRSPSRGGRRR
jgi:hypothetical protein